jgi:hypothetical protein
VRPFDFDTARAVKATPGTSIRVARERLVLLNRPGNAMPARSATALARVDLLTGRIEPFAPPGRLDPVTGRYPEFFPLFGTDDGGGRTLLALPSSSDGGPRFAASFKQDDYPALLSIFSGQQVDLLTPHPGWVWHLALARPSTPNARALLVAAAENHPLGRRASGP